MILVSQDSKLVSNSVTHITSGGLIGIAFIERADAKGHKAG